MLFLTPSHSRRTYARLLKSGRSSLPYCRDNDASSCLLKRKGKIAKEIYLTPQ